VCVCGRNLADVRRVGSNPMYTRDNLVVTARPNVNQVNYRPWVAANNANPGRTAGGVNNMRDRTYTWRCRCRRAPTRLHDWVTDIWAQLAAKPVYEPAAWRVVVDG